MQSVNRYVGFHANKCSELTTYDIQWRSKLPQQRISNAIRATVIFGNRRIHCSLVELVPASINGMTGYMTQSSKPYTSI